MEHIYPAFEQGRILKKELLLALRDYSYSGLNIKYSNYSEGIICGCHVASNKEKIIIEPGIIKCMDYIFLVDTAVEISYRPTEEYNSLKFKIMKKEELNDYTRYKTDFILDNDMILKEGEIEVCRFKLKEGSQLRTEYKDFSDIQTEFDTVNLANATWSDVHGETLAHDITFYFAQELLRCKNAKQDDIQFAYLCLQSSEGISRRIIEDYVKRKIVGLSGEKKRNIELFDYLCKVLEEIRGGSTYVDSTGWEMPEAIIVD